jgi:hypothetical protein
MKRPKWLGDSRATKPRSSPCAGFPYVRPGASASFFEQRTPSSLEHCRSASISSWISSWSLPATSAYA